ncbi:SGNH/GDSL hydrolase family protein [Candidatus Kaiserbacteria bacterium]|nr:SGNH/GDSL hydrolase family protein [Candidatus Kaiserbacteria bacterium]
MKQKSVLLTGLIAAQLLLIILLGAYVYEKWGTQFALSIGSLRRENFQFGQSAALKNFFEPAAVPGGRVEVPKPYPGWLKSRPTYTINSEGMNSGKEYAVQKPSKTFRIITLGDSWTFGFLVNTADNYSSQLEKQLNASAACGGTHFEVLNLGVPSYDIAYSAERLRVRGEKYSPDLVVWLIHDDDFTEPNEFIVSRMEQYKSEIEKSGETPNMVLKVSNGGSKYEDVQGTKPFFSGSEMNIKIAARMKAAEAVRSEWGVNGMMRYGISQLNRFRSTYAGPLVIFMYPYLGDTREVHTAVQKELQDFVSQQKNASLLSIPEDLSKIDGLLPDFHPNEKGHAIIAKDLFTYVTQHHLVPCKAL